MAHQTPRGHLKIYFGYAPGVGKTYQMLENARELQAHGADVVIGFLEPHQRKDIITCSESLAIISSRQLPFRGSTADEMDVDAILDRKPQVCVVDELAHSNVPGCERSKCWADVQVLREAGIDVLTTMNVQELASLSDQIWHITGLRVRETVPDWVFQQADEVIMVDVTPRALLHRLERGALYSPGTSQTGPAAIFQEPTLVALRELAIRQTAQALVRRQERETKTMPGWAEQRLLVNITANPATVMLRRRARHVADYLQAGCMAVCVYSEPEFSKVPAAERRVIERHLEFAGDLGIETVLIQSKHCAHALVDYARRNGVTQIFLCRRAKPTRRFFPQPDLGSQILRQAHDIEITLVAERRRQGHGPSPYPEDEAGVLMHSGYVRLSPELTVEAAIGEIRRQASQVEMISYGYVLDSSERLLGVVSLRELLSTDRRQILQQIMREECAFVAEDADKAVVAQIAAKRRLLALPVLDRDRRMRGIVSSSDILAMVQQEAGKDIQKIGGMEALDGPYLKAAD